MFSVDNPYGKVVDNFIILLVVKFDSHKSDRLEIMLFTSSVPESVYFMYRFQRLWYLLTLILKSVHGGHKKVVDDFLIFPMLKVHNHRLDGLRVTNFTKWLLCSVHCLNKFQKRIVWFG